MSEEKNIDPFLVLILILSIVGILMLTIGDFGNFYYPGYGYRYSCLSCEYYTIGDLIAQIFILILFIIQVVIALNDLLPKRFISMDLTKYGIILAALTLVFAIIGGVSFAITYGGYEWGFGIGFYGGAVGGILNAILFYLRQKNQ